MLDFVIKEIKAIPYIIVGLLVLFIGMFMSDLMTNTVDKFLKRKD
jgi:hypothetical protein